MSTYNQYDARIARILAKIETLRNQNWEPIWEPPLSEEEVAAFEAEKGIYLPEDYRRFITAYASAGKQPFGELYPLQQEDGIVQSPFPYTLEQILYFLYMTEEELDSFWDENTPFTANHGVLTLCHEGCGMKSILVVNSKDADTYGTVWYFDLANDCGIVPMYDHRTGRPFHFLDWLEYWADRTTSLAHDEHFGFCETVQLPDPPDNPNILGRKIGWIS